MSLGLPAFLVDNLLSIAQYPNLSLVGNEELAGFEAYHVADGRRSGLDYWSSITPNNPATLTWSDGRVRGADMIVLERGHNLGGVTISLLCSNDSWGTSEIVFTATIPTVSTPGGELDAVNGVVTEEGVWLKRFPFHSALAWRLSIPALGIGVLPIVVGVTVGKSWSPQPSAAGTVMFNLPEAPDADDLKVSEQESEAGWVGRGIIAPRKGGVITIKLLTTFDYDIARLNWGALYGSQGAPGFVVFDDSQSEQAFCIERPVDRHGFGRQQSWFYNQARIPYREREPLRP